MFSTSKRERVLVDADRLLRIAAHPLPCHLLDQLAPLVAIGQRERAARRQMLDLGRGRELVADEHEGARATLVIQRDVLQQAYLGRLAQVRMKIEERIYTAQIGRTNMAAAPPPARRRFAAATPTSRSMRFSPSVTVH